MPEKPFVLRLPPKHRHVVVQGSMVSLGAGAKGRSSSESLSQEMTVMVAKDICFGGSHAPTWALR